jgi:hypothetical protein
MIHLISFSNNISASVDLGKLISIAPNKISDRHGTSQVFMDWSTEWKKDIIYLGLSGKHIIILFDFDLAILILFQNQRWNDQNLDILMIE